jgi:DNA-binding transcriptional LysR family regulator
LWIASPPADVSHAGVTIRTVHERHAQTPGLDSVELRDLRYFLAVAEELNFTRAAERLHLAQQALSAAIRRLEDELGVTLFVRSTRHVALTAAGDALVEGARAVITATEAALEHVHDVAEGRTGRLTIGFSTAAGGVEVVRDIIRGFARAAPRVEVRTAEHDFADPSAGLGDGRSKVAFIFGPHPVAGLSSVTLVEEERLVAIAPDHPLARRHAIDVADLAELPWLRVPAPDGPWPAFWFRAVDSGPVGPEIRTADEWVTAIEAGRGAAFTMPSVMRNFGHARIAVLPAPGLPPAALMLAWRTSDPDPLVRAFVAAAMEHLDGTH